MFSLSTKRCYLLQVALRSDVTPEGHYLASEQLLAQQIAAPHRAIRHKSCRLR
jgi:hypothetical protein